jgi:hypothetical protein
VFESGYGPQRRVRSSPPAQRLGVINLVIGDVRGGSLGRCLINTGGRHKYQRTLRLWVATDTRRPALYLPLVSGDGPPVVCRTSTAETQHVAKSATACPSSTERTTWTHSNVRDSWECSGLGGVFRMPYYSFDLVIGEGMQITGWVDTRRSGRRIRLGSATCNRTSSRTDLSR